MTVDDIKGTDRTSDVQAPEQDPKPDNNQDQNQDQTPPEKVELTSQELEDRIKKESDRKVSRKIKELEELHKKELEKKTEEAKREAEELAKLSEAERLKVEKEKEQLRLDKERDDIKKERAELEKEKLLLQTEKELVERKLPPQAAHWIIGETADGTMENLTTFQAEFQVWVENEVHERLKSKKPLFGGPPMSEIEQIEKQYQEATDTATKVALKNKLHHLQQKQQE